MIAAIYARKSTEQNGVADAEKSVTRQIEHATDYAVGKGWSVAEEYIYCDDGISGAEFENRPGFLRLMNAITPQPPFQVLIMSEESRLGREAIETAYALKELVTAGVRVFFYLEDRERTLDSPTDKIMLSLTAYTDELEREKARQRTYDAMRRKAKAGHVTGGRVFGYDNVEILGPPDDQGRQQRSHVERRIHDAEAIVIREIFSLCAQGLGMRRIAKHLNELGAACPRAQRGRPQAWAPSSIREVLYRPLYRGEIVWNQSQKRDRWGRTRQRARPQEEWLRVKAPHLRIVPSESWKAAHQRLTGARKIYLRGTQGQLWGRPTDGVESKYLLTGLARCGVCGGSLVVRSRSHGGRRAFFYGCTSYHHRGRTVCTNALEMPLAAADEAVLSHLESDALCPEVMEAALARAVQQLATPEPDAGKRRRVLKATRKKLERDLAQLTVAITAGGPLKTLVSAIKTAERQVDQVDTELAGLDGRACVSGGERQRIERELRVRLDDWRGLLRRHVPQARQILRKLLVDRVVFTPKTDYYEFTGSWTLGKLVSGVVDLPQRMVSPTGLGLLWTPEIKGKARVAA